MVDKSTLLEPDRRPSNYLVHLMRNLLERLHYKLQGIIAPGLRYSQEIYEEVLDQRVTSGTGWLDVGCGHQVLGDWRRDAERQMVARSRAVVGLDMDRESLNAHGSISARVMGNVGTLPFGDRTFELVTANMVVEHLNDPLSQFREVSRVLAPGGLFLFHTPNVFGYPTIIARIVPEAMKPALIGVFEGRKDVDVFKTFYRANSEGRILELAQQAGFATVETRMIASSAMFEVLPPLLVPELLWIRLLMNRPFRSLRSNIIAVLRKPISAD